MLELFAAAFVFGLIFNATPGAVFAETVRRGALGGFRNAFAVQLGSLVGDASWAVLGLLGIGLLLQIEALRWPLGLAGALYLLWLARDSWLSATRLLESAEGLARLPLVRESLRSGVLLSITNPQNIAFWGAIGGALGAAGVMQPDASDYVTFFSGFMSASIAWAFVCAGLIDVLFARLGQAWVAFTYRLCALMFLALALKTLWDLAGSV